MKKILYLLLCLMTAQEMAAQCPQNTVLGSTVNTWDWRTGSYDHYFNTAGTPLYNNAHSPFYAVNLSSEPNVSVFQIPLLKDFEPSDGWELLAKNFGTPTQGVNAGFFALYNRYESRIRLFVLVPYKASAQTANISIYFANNILNPDNYKYQSALFEHLNGRNNAVEKQAIGVRLDIPNKYTNDNYTWFHADIPVAYDPCTCAKQTGLEIKPQVTTISNITLKMQGSGTIIQQIVANNTVVGTDALKDVLIPAANKGTAVYNSTKGMENELIKTGAQMEKEPVLAELGALVKLIPKWLIDVVPYATAALGFIEFINAGGKKPEAPPSPAVFNTTNKFEATGQINTTYDYGITNFYIPGSNQVGLSPALKPTYNNILGTFNLLEVPQVYVATETADYNNKTAPDPHTFVADAAIKTDSIQARNGTGVFSPADGGNTSTRTYYRYQLKNDVSYVINPASGLSQTPVGVQGALFFTFESSNTVGCALDISTSLIKVYQEVGSASSTYRTPYMPLGCLKDFVAEWSAKRSGYGYCYSYAPTVSLQVLATLRRDPLLDPFPNILADDVFFAAKYNVGLDNTSKTYAQLAAPAYNIPINRTVTNLNVTANTTLAAWNTITIGSGVTVAPGVTLTLQAGGEINMATATLPSGIDIQIGLPTACGRVVPAKSATYISSFCGNSAKYNPVLPRLAQAEEPTTIDKANTASFTIYPNPSSQIFTANIALVAESDITLSLTDMLGRKIENLRFQGVLGQGSTAIPVDVSHLVSGIYVVTLQTSDGGLKTIKFVKN